MESDAEGFWYPDINKDDCVNCGLCEQTCPVLHNTELKHTPTAYAAYNKNDVIRRESSSGGLFTLIAEHVIDNGGVVFGAVFNENFNVLHVAAECKEDLSKMRCSKYVQSKIGDTYKQAEDLLKQGRRVLFTGTPCQISGLKSYLGREYDNLMCQDIICHGVPSPMVWQKYVAFREKKAAATVNAASFRSKINGWKDFSLSMIHENGVEYSDTINRDMYLVAFNKNLYLRPSCYSCVFKTEQREADITLADFWGIQNVVPEMDDDKGTSLLIIHSEKGHRVFDEIKDKVISLQVEIKDAAKYNPAMMKSMAVHPYRKDFFAALNSSEFDTLINKYCKDKLSERIKGKANILARKALLRIGLFDLAKKVLRRR